MNQDNKFFTLIMLFTLFNTVLLAQNDISLQSPDGSLEFILKADKELTYQINYQNKLVVLKSPLGIVVQNQPDWNKNLNIKEIGRITVDTTWSPIYGEREIIPDNYQQAVAAISSSSDPVRKLHLIIRAYNEGIAFKYYFPEQLQTQSLNIEEEITTFTFPENSKAWYTPRPQGEYELKWLDKWEKPAEMPLTLELSNGVFVSITEAQMVNYSVSQLTTVPNKSNTLKISMSDQIIETSPLSSPWRVIMVAEKPGALLENNYIVYNLNPPSEIQYPWWIKPGKVIREVTLSTEGAKACVDFAVDHNLQFIHFDAGWYGHEYHIGADATTVTVDPRRNPEGDLDLHEAIRYAKNHDIKVFTYVNHRALEKQLDEILPLYKSWGIDGIKFGFVHTGSHRWTVWLHEAIKKAAKHHLMVNVHDQYRPTGFSRTYPNLMTMEGIRGNEEMPDATHNTVLPFTRFVAGKADYTICYYFREEFGKEKRHIKTTPAHQLALAAIYYSPLQWLFWYDKPNDYQGEPEVEFFAKCPTVWDETRVIDGNIGNYAIVARRSGNDWFIGAITNIESRQLILDLDFLDTKKKYLASFYTDGGEEIDTRTQVKIERFLVDEESSISLNLKASGGAAIHITEATVENIKQFQKITIKP